MQFWKRFQSWWWSTVPVWARGPVTWVFHGLVAALVMLPFVAFGYPGTGFCVGVGVYAFRELVEVLGHGPKWDNFGDVLGPVVSCSLMLWVL